MAHHAAAPQPWTRRLLAQTVSADIANRARNVYLFKQRGYLLASGDRTQYNFRFDADPETIRQLISSARGDKLEYFEDQDVNPSGPGWWVRGRVRYYPLSDMRIWIDRNANRVFITTYSRD